MVGGVDVKVTNQDDLSPAISGRAGIQAAHSRAGGHPARLVSLLFEVYSGPSETPAELEGILHLIEAMHGVIEVLDQERHTHREDEAQTEAVDKEFAPMWRNRTFAILEVFRKALKKSVYYTV